MFDNIPEFKLIRSKRKSIGIRISDKGELIVRAPLYVSKRVINSVVLKNMNWIEQKKKEIELKNRNKKKFIQGEKLLFLGKEYEIRFVLDQKDSIKFKGAFLISYDKKDKAEDIVIKFYKDRAYEILSERVKYYSIKYGFEYNKFKINSAKKRWGSCSSKGNLNFSFYLIMAPLEIIDYVVVHELCHLRIKNHSKEFYNLVKSILPEYKTRIAHLKILSPHLTL